MFSNRKQVSLAVGGSVLLHVLILFTWALTIQWLPRPKQAPRPPPPIHLEIVKAEETPPLVAAETPEPAAVPFIDTSGIAPSAHPPESAKFDSGQDTEAASLKASTGDQPLPSMDGKKMPSFAFNTTAYQPGEAPAQAKVVPVGAPPPQVEAAPTPRQSTPTPAPAHTPVPDDEFGLPAPTPTPEDKEPVFDPAFRSPDSTMPDRPTVASRSANQSDAAGFQSNQEKAAVSGNITKRGFDSVDAVATPAGHYRTMVISAISRKWYAYFNARSDMVAIGTVHIHFIVDRSGRVMVPRVIANTSNAGLASVSLQAVLDAAIPPMPSEAERAMRGELSMDLFFDSQ